MTKTTPAQREYLTDLAEGRSRGCANRRDARVAFALRDKGLIAISSEGVRITDAGLAVVTEDFTKAL